MDQNTNELSNKAEIKVDDSLLTSISGMNNSDIGNMLFNYIISDNINDFNVFTKHCSIF